MRTKNRALKWLSQQVRNGLAQLALASFRKPLVALSVIIILTVVAGFATVGRLSLNADLTELLPQSFRSVQDLEMLKERFGGIGYVVVVARNAPPEALEEFAADVGPKLEELPTVRYVEYKRPTKFFEDRALYFLDVEDLELVRDRLEERMAWEKRRANPLYLDLEDSDPPPVEFTELKEKYAGRGDTSWVATQMGETYYLDRGERLIALLCKPASLSTDIGFSREIFGQVKGLVDELDLSKYHPDMEIAYAGNYTKKVDQHDMIMQDLKIATSVAALLVILYLIFHFRRFAAVGLIIGPLLVGLVWTHAFAAVAFGALNILTGFIGAILMGLGIDHGIHLLGRFEGEWGAQAGREDAISETFGDTGRSVAVAALTTTVAFAGLGISEFRAFREFGVIAAGGMAMVVIAYLVTLPALLGLATRWGWKPRAHDRTQQSTFAKLIPRHAGKVLAVAVLLAIPAAIGFPQATFNYNFRSLVASDLESFRLDHEVDKLLGFSQTPVVVMAQDEEEERLIAQALRARQEQYAEETTIDFVATGADLIPLNQEKKAAIIGEIADIISDVKPKMLDKELRPQLAQVKRMTKVEPFTKESLPIEVRRQFQGPDGDADDGFVLVFPAVDLSHGARVSEFAKELRGVPLEDGRRISAAGEPMILADIFDMVEREAAPVLSITLVLVFLTIWFLLGKLRFGVICLLPAALTLAGTIALLHFVGLELNYINIVMIPVLFGIGVDGGVHIATRVAETGDVTEVIGETGRAIAGAILTTGLGFGALLLADHHGLNSLGDMAVLGLAVNLVACLIVLPALLAWKPSLVCEPAAEPSSNQEATAARSA